MSLLQSASSVVWKAGDVSLHLWVGTSTSTVHFLHGNEPHIGMGDGFEAQTLKVHMDQETPRL